MQCSFFVNSVVNISGALIMEPINNIDNQTIYRYFLAYTDYVKKNKNKPAKTQEDEFEYFTHFKNSDDPLNGIKVEVISEDKNGSYVKFLEGAHCDSKGVVPTKNIQKKKKPTPPEPYRYVYLGKYTADLKLMQMMLANQPFNTDHYRMLIKGHSHKRGRGDLTRFNSPITATLEFRSIKEDETDEVKAKDKYESADEIVANYVGNTWALKYNNNTLPSVDQIEKGITQEALVQLQQDLWDIESVDIHNKAKNNLSESWKKLWEKAQVKNRYEALTPEILRDPKHPVVVTTIWCYSADTFLFQVLNESSRKKDESKVITLGPFACVLGWIVGHAHQYRTDIDP